MSEFWPREQVVAMDNRALAHLIRCHPGMTPPDLRAVLCPKILPMVGPDPNDEVANILTELVKPEPLPTRITRKMILRLCTDIFNVTALEILSHRRERRVTHPRMVAMYLCSMFTKSTLADIGREFNRDHTTVIKNLRRIKKFVDKHNIDGGDDPKEWMRAFASAWRL